MQPQQLIPYSFSFSYLKDRHTTNPSPKICPPENLTTFEIKKTRSVCHGFFKQQKRKLLRCRNRNISELHCSMISLYHNRTGFTFFAVKRSARNTRNILVNDNR